MNQVIFKIVSESSGQQYELVAKSTERGLLFRCNCQAGVMGQLCKHRQALITGQLADLPELNEIDMTTFKAWLSMSRIGAIQESIAAADDEVKQAKKRVTMLKRELGRRLEEGTA